MERRVKSPPDSSTSAAAAELYRIQATGCRLAGSPSPFYATLLDALAVDAASGGTAASVVADVVDLGLAAAIPLRLLGGVHRGVLAGELPSLARHFPSVGGDGDAEAAAAALLTSLATPSATIRNALKWDPQTNEVGRAAALAIGLGAIAATTQLPIRLLEIGSSAGLNLRLDRYWYGVGGGWGDPNSPVRFEAADFEEVSSAGSGSVPFSLAPTIVDRVGCDVNPLDASSDAGALTLLGYVWPDQHDRAARLRAALAVARDSPLTISCIGADAFVAEQFVASVGVVTVLMHSIVWQYLPKAAQRRIEQVVTDRVSTASVSAPLAWLRFEPRPDQAHPETRVRIWPHAPESRIVAESTYHGPPVRVRI
jgi:hypothetical protein